MKITAFTATEVEIMWAAVLAFFRDVGPPSEADRALTEKLEKLNDSPDHKGLVVVSPQPGAYEGMIFCDDRFLGGVNRVTSHVIANGPNFAQVQFCDVALAHAPDAVDITPEQLAILARARGYHLVGENDLTVRAVDSVKEAADAWELYAKAVDAGYDVLAGELLKEAQAASERRRKIADELAEGSDGEADEG